MPAQYGTERGTEVSRGTDWTTVWHELGYIDATPLAIQHYALTVLVILLVILIWADNHKLRAELARYRGES